MASNSTLIIGKRSNLSRALATRIPGATLVASDDLHTLPGLLNGSYNIIYNVYQKSTLLSQTTEPEAYAKYAFTALAEFVAHCLAHQQHINTIIFTSSSAVYGNNAHASEADKPDITNLYASLKLASEFFLRDHLKSTSIRLIIPRLFNMYGGDDQFSVVSKIVTAIAGDQEISVTNNGSSVRDFIHIDDVAAIYAKLLQSSHVGVVNVGTGEGVSVAQLIEMAETSFKKKLRIAHTKREEIARSVAAIDALTKAIGPYQFKTVDGYYREKTS